MVYLELFHGRKLGEELDDWGTQGPIFKADYFHTTYATEIKFNDRNVLTIVSGDSNESQCVYYDGVYYGDWSVFGQGTFKAAQSELKARLATFDPEKAKLPEVKLSNGGN